MKVLKDIGVDWRDRRSIVALHMGQRAVLRLKHRLTSEAGIGRGTKKGCLLSPILFNVYAEATLRKAPRDVDEGICVGVHLIKSVRFADDHATIVSLVKGLQDMMARMNHNADSFGMKINIKRTQLMKISKSLEKEFTIMLGVNELAQVKQFTHLGSIITQEGDCGRDIRTRIAHAKDAFSSRKELLIKSFSLTLKRVPC